MPSRSFPSKVSPFSHMHAIKRGLVSLSLSAKAEVAEAATQSITDRRRVFSKLLPETRTRELQKRSRPSFAAAAAAPPSDRRPTVA